MLSRKVFAMLWEISPNLPRVLIYLFRLTERKRALICIIPAKSKNFAPEQSSDLHPIISALTAGH